MEENKADQNPVASKKPMTDEERLELAAKLDKDLDDFINGLEKRQYTEGWAEDKWEEEMEKHPFFMKKLPEAGDELNPLFEGLQQLKYDPEENTAEELATSYKEDGNFNFKHKKYRLAILSYTEGIKQNHENNELKATLYNNRAAANFYLKNYRSCLRDCEISLRLKPNYTKASVRAAQCCFETSQWDKCVQHCDEVLLVCPTDTTTRTLRQKAINERKVAERNKRRQNRELAARQAANEKLLNEIKKRNIKLATSKKNKDIDDNEIDILKPIVEQLDGAKVHLDEETKQLVWPLVLVYPEFGIMDFIREISEQDTLHLQLSEVFHEPAEWDPDHKYSADTVSTYFEEKLSNGDVCLHEVSVNCTLLEVLTTSGFEVYDGTPQIIVLERGSNHQTHFIEQYDLKSLLK